MPRSPLASCSNQTLHEPGWQQLIFFRPDAHRSDLLILSRYLGREVAMTQRRLITQYRLPERRYLGPTSMDTEMAFLIANQAQESTYHPVIRASCCPTLAHALYQLTIAILS